MKNILFKLSALVIFALGAMILPHATQAATLRVVANDASANVGQPVQVDISLDTKGDNANAIQATILFPTNLFTLQQIVDGASPVTFWIDPPKETASGAVSFSGIIPGGFNGAASSVVSLVLNPIAQGSGVVNISSVALLRNDGHGTAIAVSTSSASVTVSREVPGSSGSPSLTSSIVTPEPFTPVVSSDSNIFAGHYFLAFSTVDKGSGIDHYEILEVPTGNAGQVSSWQVAVSPYELHDQALASDIYVRAVDHAGNFIVEKISAAHPAPNYIPGVHGAWNMLVIFLAAALLILAVLLGLRALLRARRR